LQKPPNKDEENSKTIPNENLIATFALIGKRYQLDDKTLYYNVNELLAFANSKLESRALPLHNYSKATFYILGFDKLGKTFYGV